MANITFARVDHRLIHGQVITKWSKIACAQKILIVDDVLGQDSFMVDIYKMAAPSGIDVDIKSAQATADAYKADDLGAGNIFLLFKSIQMVRKAVDAGLELKALQLGGVPSEGGRKIVFQAVALNDEDVADLTHLAEVGVDITLQVVPEESGMTLAEALKKYNS